MSSIAVDDIYPRDAEHRYRLYAVIGDERKLLAAAPAEGVGTMLLTLHNDYREIGRRLIDEGRLGILDVMPGGNPHRAGEWVVQPYDRRPA